ncbi:MAG: helix-hairpin-helix domain-containing protein [Oscillospiraceae bacterium]|nr:helix-hairpin-helix domain-containing protein [Oscillospiraceae bacterium]
MKLPKSEKAALIITACFVVALVGYLFGSDARGSDFSISAENKYARAVPASPSEDTGGAGAPYVSAEDRKVNINTAGAEELKTLPGIGEILAERIIAYRKENGDFKHADDIMNVNGIGEAKYAAVSDLITTT